MTADVRLTRIKKHGGALLCKRIVLGEDGRPKSDGSPCAMSRGSAERVVFNGTPATELATTILDLGSHEAIVLGDLADGLGDRIQIEKDANADPASGTHGRTRRTFSFRDGVPAACLLDFDQKAMPDDVRERLTAMGGFEGALASLIPGYAGLARVVPRFDLVRHLQRRDGRTLPEQRGRTCLRLRRRRQRHRPIPGHPRGACLERGPRLDLGRQAWRPADPQHRRHERRPAREARVRRTARGHSSTTAGSCSPHAGGA